MQKKANEIFLSFLTNQKTVIPVLLNVVLLENADHAEIHCGGMQISQRNRFEKELLEAKKTSEIALNENVELIKTRNELQAAQRDLENQLRNLSEKTAVQMELSKVLSHDLQEPLRKISLFSSRLLNGQSLDISQDSAHALKKITGFVEQVRHLLDDLQKFNSLNSKNLKYEQINLSDAIAAAQNHSALIGKNVEINYHASTIIFNSDKKLITNLFIELIKNAIRFKNPEITRLKIAIKADVITENIYTETKHKYHYEDFLRIRFDDNGMGNQHLERNAFPLFSKSGKSDDELGIGMAYSRRIVQMLNGKISVSATPSGRSFTLTFPFKDVS